MHFLATPSSDNVRHFIHNPLRNEYRRQRRRALRLTAKLAVRDLPAVNDHDFQASAAIANLDSELQSLSPAQLHDLQANLLEEAAQTRPLISVLTSLNELREEYLGGSMSFVKKIDWLMHNQGFKGIRRTRGDGDCFYRSLAFSYVERLLRAPDVALAVATSVSVLQSSSKKLDAAGFQPMVYEDMLELVISLIQQIIVPDEDGVFLDVHTLLEAMQDPQTSNSIVVLLRLLTSAQIREDPDTYAPFLFHPETFEAISIRDFCESSVEAMGREADHVQMSALTRALKVNLRVAYLSGRGDEEKVDFVEMNNVPEGQNGMKEVVLLYRPGHYDILEYRDEDV